MNRAVRTLYGLGIVAAAIAPTVGAGPPVGAGPVGLPNDPCGRIISCEPQLVCPLPCDPYTEMVLRDDPVAYYPLAADLEDHLSPATFDDHEGDTIHEHEFVSGLSPSCAFGGGVIWPVVRW